MRVGLEFSFHKQPPVEEGSRDEDHWRERLRSRLVVVGSEALGAVLQTCVCVCSVAQSCLTPCDPMDCSPPGSFVHWILQARILEWVVISYSRGSSQSRDQTRVSCISCTGRGILYH